MSTRDSQPPPPGPNRNVRDSPFGPTPVRGNTSGLEDGLVKVLVGCGAAAILIGGCVVVGRALNQPTTRAEVCSAYADFAQEWFEFSASEGLFDNKAFDSMEDLADVAKRYPDNPAVKSDGDRLEKLAEGDGGFIVSVSAASADSASRNIAGECR